MEHFKQVCRDMAANPEILTFSDLARAAVNGAAVGQKVNEPLIGAVLGVSLEAGKRAVRMTEALIKDLNTAPKVKDDAETGETKQQITVRSKLRS